MEEAEKKYQMLTNKIMYTFILYVLFLGCQHNNKKTGTVSAKDELVMVEPLKEDTLNQDKNKDFIDEKNIVVIPDTSINKKLFLENYKSLSNFCSNKKSLPLVEMLRESPVVIFGNKSEKQYLLAYQYEGSSLNNYSCFEIGYFEDDIDVKLEKFNKIEEVDFHTESGLRLGLSFEEVVQIKGGGYKQQKISDYIVLNYRIEDYENSFLKEYNMPGYFIEIKLKNNMVSNIKFGFDYP